MNEETAATIWIPVREREQMSVVQHIREASHYRTISIMGYQSHLGADISLRGTSTSQMNISERHMMYHMYVPDGYDV